MSYLLRSYTMPADLEEAVAGELWAAGTLGFQVVEGSGGRVRVEAYFPGPAGERVADDPLAGWTGVEGLGTTVVPEQDWLAPWRERARPFDVGKHFRVDPREPEEAGPQGSGPKESGPAQGRDGEGGAERSGTAEGEAAGEKVGEVVGAGAAEMGSDRETADRRLLRLPARAAFGVGSHESTRLALELLETLDLAGRSVLDVGTGTGILAFAALHLGARRAVAFDVDPAAAVAARDNARLNGLYPLLFTGTAAALAGTGDAGSPGTGGAHPAERTGRRFDWTLVNVVPEQVAEELPELARRSGGLVLSGILAEKGPEVLATVAALGFRERRRAVAGEWTAFVLDRPGEGSGAAPDGPRSPTPDGRRDDGNPGDGNPGGAPSGGPGGGLPGEAP